MKYEQFVYLCLCLLWLILTIYILLGTGEYYFTYLRKSNLTHFLTSKLFHASKVQHRFMFLALQIQKEFRSMPRIYINKTDRCERGTHAMDLHLSKDIISISHAGYLTCGTSVRVTRWKRGLEMLGCVNKKKYNAGVEKRGRGHRRKPRSCRKTLNEKRLSTGLDIAS